jgi:hypothetical protein
VCAHEGVKILARADIDMDIAPPGVVGQGYFGNIVDARQRRLQRLPMLPAPMTPILIATTALAATWLSSLDRPLLRGGG